MTFLFYLFISYFTPVPQRYIFVPLYPRYYHYVHILLEGFNPGEIFQRARGPVQTGYQSHGQVAVLEAPKKIQEKYLQIHFIPYLQRK